MTKTMREKMDFMAAHRTRVMKAALDAGFYGGHGEPHTCLQGWDKLKLAAERYQRKADEVCARHEARARLAARKAARA